MSIEEHVPLKVHLNQLASNQFAKMLHVSSVELVQESEDAFRFSLNSVFRNCLIGQDF